MNIIYLTPEQELKVLEKCRGNFVANGSSRAVYSLEHEGEIYAVKVFLDNGGRVQTLAEIKMFGLFPDGDVVARIYAVGKTCIISEWIEYIDDDIIYTVVHGGIRVDVMWENHEFRDCISFQEVFEQITYIHDVLTDWCGPTADNTQIGFSPIRRHFVAYDYGYNTETSRHEQVGHMEDYICNYDDIIAEAESIVQDLGYRFIDYYDDPDYDGDSHYLEDEWDADSKESYLPF